MSAFRVWYDAERSQLRALADAAPVFVPDECNHERVDGFAGDQWCRDCGELLDDISGVDL